jgi:hypothetical protein
MGDWVRQVEPYSVVARYGKYCSLSGMQVILGDSTICPNQQCTSFVGVFVIFVEKDSEMCKTVI